VRARLNKVREDPAFSPNYFWQDSSGQDFPGDGGVDARVLYDQFEQRFVVTTYDGPNAHLYLAVSNGGLGDPASHTSWQKFYVDTKLCIPGSCLECSTYRFEFPGLAVTDDNIYVTVFQTRAAEGYGGSLHIFKKPALTDPPSLYDRNPSNCGSPNYNRLDIPLGHSAHTPAETLPMPAHFFGQLPTETAYLVQVWKRRDPGPDPMDPSDDFGVIRLSAVTDPFATTPTLRQVLLGVSPIDRTGDQHREQRCSDPLEDPKVFPAYGTIQNVVWRGGKLYFAHDDVKVDSYGGRFVTRWYVVNLNDWPHGAASAYGLRGRRRGH